MELSEMTLEDIEKRLAELDIEVRDAEDLEVVNKATEEKRGLVERKAELVEIETRKAEAEALQQGEAQPEKLIEKREEIKMEENKVFGTDSKEYRDAFYAMLAGKATAEQRAILATPISVDGDGTDDGMAIAIPTTLDEKIWDNIHSAHPILADITTINSGIIMQVTKHTAITAGAAKSKKDGASNATASVVAEENTFVKVNLVGKDYTKFVELTYAEAKMSQGALEDYLAEEIAADLGEAMAKDVFAQIISDGSSNVTTKGSNPWFATIAGALGSVKNAVKPVIYTNASNYYSLFGDVDTNGQPVFRDGVAIGAEVKIDSAVPSTVLAVVVDPKKFVLNVVQSTMIETDRDIKEHKVVISGYARAEGVMRDNNAAGSIVA